MEFNHPMQFAVVPQNSDQCFSQPCHAGFEGLNAVERAAHAEILHRAYSIWECKGRPDNCQLAHWLEAKAEVMGES